MGNAATLMSVSDLRAAARGVDSEQQPRPRAVNRSRSKGFYRDRRAATQPEGVPNKRCPRAEVVITVRGRHGSAPCALKRVGEDIAQKLDYQPAVFTVEHIAHAPIRNAVKPLTSWLAHSDHELNTQPNRLPVQEMLARTRSARNILFSSRGAVASGTDQGICQTSSHRSRTPKTFAKAT